MIDVDDSTTWPDWLRPWTAERFGAEYGRLIEEDDAFRAQFRETEFLAFHCTRLLDHELTWIRERGLRPLTLELVEERIRVAHERGHLGNAERDYLLTSNTFAARDDRNRRDEVCLILGRGAFDEAFGCEPLLAAWGGEAIYRYAGNLESRLGGLGVPSIVVARVDLSAKARALTFPALGKLFVEVAREPRSYHASVHHRDVVSPEEILDIWQPGHPEYDWYRDLPR